jgi:hypothetical protein
MTIRLSHTPEWRSFDVMVFRKGGLGMCELYAADGLTLKKQDEGARIESVCRLSEENAIRLMNDLWNAGIRPTGERNKDETISAVMRHLDDMRAIVGAKLNVPLPK